MMQFGEMMSVGNKVKGKLLGGCKSVPSLDML